MLVEPGLLLCQIDHVRRAEDNDAYYSNREINAELQTQRSIPWYFLNSFLFILASVNAEAHLMVFSKFVSLSFSLSSLSHLNSK